MTESQTSSLEQQRYFLASIVDSSKDSIVTIDFNSVITSWNKAAEHLYGYPANQAIGKSLSMVMLPEDIRQLLVNIERIRNSNDVEIYDTIRIRKGGELVHLEIMLSPVKNDVDEVIGVSTIARDITAWAIADAALRNSEEKFRALVSQTSVGIYQADLDHNFIFANDTLCTILGVPREEIINHSVWMQCVDEDVENEKKLFERFTETSTPFESDKRIKTKDGKIKWVRESVSPIYSPEGKLASSMGVVVDITEQKNIDRHKDEFISIASHELKTPLTSLKVYGEILEDKLTRNNYSDSVFLAQKINRQIERFGKLIAQLLDTGKITAGGLVLQKEIFNLSNLILDVIEEQQKLTTIHTLKLVSDCHVLTYAEEERIRQVLTNLISNAIKYSPDGGDITIACEENESFITVTVTDNGIGIPTEALSKVFDRFFRVQTKQNENIGGIGLGLYITSQIIRKHGGSITVRSNEGHGAVFCFTIPR